MDHVNKTLLLSLKQDLQTLNESIQNINVDVSLQSWLFPTKNYKFVKDFMNENNIWEIKDVRLMLELIIDRLYTGLRLILTTIKNNIKDDSLETNSFILLPPHMTVGCCFESLRKIVDILLDKMNDKSKMVNSATEELDTKKRHCKTQTDVASIATCDSCASAIMSMKFLLNIFDVAKDDIYQVKMEKNKYMHSDWTVYEILSFELPTTTANGLSILVSGRRNSWLLIPLSRQNKVFGIDKLDAIEFRDFSKEIDILMFLSRRRAQSSLHDLTQFGCMLHTTASIEKSLKQLIEKLMKADDHNRELSEKVKKLTTQLQNKSGTVTLMEQENIALNDTLKKTGVQLAILKNKISELEINKLRYEDEVGILKTANSDFGSTVCMYREVNSRLKEEKYASEANFQKVRTLVKLCVQKIPNVEKKLMVLEREQYSFLGEFNVLNTSLDVLSARLKIISRNHTGMEHKIKMLSGDVSESTEYITKEFKTFQEKIQEKLLNASINNVTVSQSSGKNLIKGNPVEDFTRQIEENNEKIKSLQNENKKLENILTKFKNIKK